GIPDYRGATGSLRRHTPMTYQTFTRDPRGRHRHSARRLVGWRPHRGGAPARLRRHTPMTYQTFTRDPRGRHRYWARSFVGWRQIRAARPNDGHRAVGALQAAGLLGGVITQNVDGLHQAGGAREVVELHGGLDRTVCLSCGDVASRAALDERLQAADPPSGGRRAEINTQR